MLPLSTLGSCRAHELPFGALGWLTSGNLETLLVVNNDDEPFAIVFGELPFSCPMSHLDGDALFIKDWKIEVDPKSAKTASHVNSAHGLLMVSKSMVNILFRSADSPQWGHAPLPVPDDFGSSMQRGMAFSRWKIVTWLGDERVVLLDIDTDKLAA